MENGRIHSSRISVPKRDKMFIWLYAVCLADSQRILRVYFMYKNRITGQNPPWLFSPRLRFGFHLDDHDKSFRQIQSILEECNLRFEQNIFAFLFPLLVIITYTSRPRTHNNEHLRNYSTYVFLSIYNKHTFLLKYTNK